MAKERTPLGIRVAVVGDKKFRKAMPETRSRMASLMERAVLRGLIKVEGGTKGRLDNKVLMRRTSTLIRSVHYELHARGMDSWGAVGTPIVYGKTHELGLTVRPHGKAIKMPKRPFLQPSLDEHEAEIVRDIQRALQEGINK